MIPLPNMQDKVVGVVGLGKTGKATVAALRAAGAQVAVWDDNATSRADFMAERQVHVTVEPPAQWHWESIDLIVMSPGIPYTHPKPHEVVELAQKHGVEIVGDIELLYRACPEAMYIAITGTNGKSTTTSLIGHILKAAGKTCEVGGNLGEPVMHMQSLGKGDVYVLELSSYQLDLVRSTKFDVAVLLNLSEDHLDRHGDMAGYMGAKQHIFENQDRECAAIVGVDDAYCEGIARSMIDANNQQVIPIGVTQTIGNGIYVKEGILTNSLADGMTLDLNAIPTLQGAHNHQNAAAAYAACFAAGLQHDVIAQHILSYPGLAHRMQFLGEGKGVRFVNDSKATNADAAARSLGTYDKILWIAGGVAKSGGIESLASYFPRIEKTFLIGDAQDAFATTLEGRVACTKSGTLAQAVQDAMAYATEHNMHDAVLLLAPACASFDQFKNFEERGDAFAELVKPYIETELKDAV